MNHHPGFDESMLSAYLDGELQSQEVQLVERVIAESPEARTLLAELAHVRSLVSSLNRLELTRTFETGPWTAESKPTVHLSEHENGREKIDRWRLLAVIAASVLLLGSTVVLVSRSNMSDSKQVSLATESSESSPARFSKNMELDRRTGDASPGSSASSPPSSALDIPALATNGAARGAITDAVQEDWSDFFFSLAESAAPTPLNIPSLERFRQIQPNGEITPADKLVFEYRTDELDLKLERRAVSLQYTSVEFRIARSDWSTASQILRSIGIPVDEVLADGVARVSFLATNRSNSDGVRDAMRFDEKSLTRPESVALRFDPIPSDKYANKESDGVGEGEHEEMVSDSSVETNAPSDPIIVTVFFGNINSGEKTIQNR